MRCPSTSIVAGGSYIGLEFAQMYRRFGARVTVIENGDRLIAREDAEVSREVQAILEREGVAFHSRCARRRCAGANGQRRAHRARQRRRARPSSKAATCSPPSAASPTPTTSASTSAGIATDARGYIAVDDELRTNVAGVWALGDVNGRGAFTHTSYNDFEIVAANLLDGGQRRVSDRIPAYALFIDPPLGRVGMTEAEVRARGKPALVGMMPMTRVGRARERGETQGFMKVLVDAESERILGAALLGIEGDEIVHSLLDVMAADAPYTVIRDAVHIHPTVSELIPTLLEKLVPL